MKQVGLQRPSGNTPLLFIINLIVITPLNDNPIKSNASEFDLSLLKPLELQIPFINSTGFMNVTFKPACFDLNLTRQMNKSNIVVSLLQAS
jgi:hypothetical protein